MTDQEKIDIAIKLFQSLYLCKCGHFNDCEDCGHSQLCNTYRMCESNKYHPVRIADTALSILIEGEIDTMSVERMREKVRDAYPGYGWKEKVSHMSENQIIALYYKFLDEGKIAK